MQRVKSKRVSSNSQASVCFFSSIFSASPFFLNVSAEFCMHVFFNYDLIHPIIHFTFSASVDVLLPFDVTLLKRFLCFYYLAIHVIFFILNPFSLPDVFVFFLF